MVAELVAADNRVTGLVTRGGRSFFGHEKARKAAKN
jgi:hypothetical protein